MNRTLHIAVPGACVPLPPWGGPGLEIQAGAKIARVLGLIVVFTRVWLHVGLRASKYDSFVASRASSILGHSHPPFPTRRRRTAFCVSMSHSSA